MDTALLVVCVGAYLGLLAQARIKEDSIRWLSLALATGGMILSLESGLSATAITILFISQFIVWIYSAISVLRSFGGDV